MTRLNALSGEAEIETIYKFAMTRAGLQVGGFVSGTASNNNSKGGFLLEMLSEIKPQPAKDWLVYGFLGAGEFSTLYGEPSAGKSIVAGEIALSVASGAPWFGLPVMKAPVLYFAAERRGVMARRLLGLQRCKDAPTDIPLCLASGALDIRADSSADKFLDEIARLEDHVSRSLGLVVLDTFSRTLSGGDENSPVDVGNAVRNIERIRERCGAHIMALHHVGVSLEAKSRMRGSSLILGAIDSGALVTKGNGGGLTIRVTKSNDSPEDFELRAGVASFPTGRDSEGNETSVPYLIEPAGNMTGRAPLVSLAKRPTKIQTAAMASLAKAIAVSGLLPPEDAPGGCPAGVMSVSSDEWRAVVVADAEGESPKPTESALRMRFQRTAENLKAAGRVGSNGSRFWAVN